MWVDFFTWLRGKGHAGVFVNGFLSLGFGSVIVAFVIGGVVFLALSALMTYLVLAR